jgi:hypothetical protein
MEGKRVARVGGLGECQCVRRRGAAIPPTPARPPQPPPTSPHPAPPVGNLGASAAWALKSKAALLLAAVVRQQGPDAFAAVLPQLMTAAAEGPLQVGGGGFGLMGGLGRRAAPRHPCSGSLPAALAFRASAHSRAALPPPPTLTPAPPSLPSPP